MVTVDPVTFSVVWRRFIAVCDEMGSAISRTAYSQAVREARDYGAHLYDSTGRLVAQGLCSPGHFGPSLLAAKNALAEYPAETLRPGDAIVFNDPQLGLGHLSDFFIICPVFYKGQIVAMVGTSAHQADVGGMAPGSQAVEGISEIYQEGIRVVPTKLYDQGRQTDAFKFIAANVRVPEMVTGDLQAQMNANNVGASRLLDMIDKYGLETVESCMRRILEESEAAMKKAIATLPRGTASFEDFLDDYGRGTEPVKVKMTVSIKDGEILIDFAGSSPQVPAGFNCYLGYTYSYGYYVSKCIADPNIPQNDGSAKPIKVVAPEGSFFNAKLPAPCGGRATVAHRIVSCAFGVFSQMVPDRIPAAASHGANACLGGMDPKKSKPFAHMEMLSAGFGGRPTKDGLEYMRAASNGQNIPFEVVEGSIPILVLAHEVIPDSGGAGKYRGGCGVQRDIKMLTGPVKFSNINDRQKFPSFGLYGGKPGAMGLTVLNPGEKEELLHSKGVYSLRDGDIVRYRMSGAGGWGDPFERDIEAVVSDVENGFVSIEGARRDYGVVLDPETLTVDLEETKALRSTQRSNR